MDGWRARAIPRRATPGYSYEEFLWPSRSSSSAAFKYFHVSHCSSGSSSSQSWSRSSSARVLDGGKHPGLRRLLMMVFGCSIPSTSSWYPGLPTSARLRLLRKQCAYRLQVRGSIPDRSELVVWMLDMLLINVYRAMSGA